MLPVQLAVWRLPNAPQQLCRQTCRFEVRTPPSRETTPLADYPGPAPDGTRAERVPGKPRHDVTGQTIPPPSPRCTPQGPLGGRKE
eukprot:1608367-Alexandrium_andersonii.AAC.1